MMFTRTLAYLKRRDWTAVLIELIIVVLGVFIGIQVANWNQALADRQLGRAYAERLSAELELNLASQRAVVAYYGAVLDSIERTDALLADPHADPKELVVNAYRSSEINYTPQMRATWDEIVSSGIARLLPRAVTDSGVADYYARDAARDAFDTLWGSAYRHRVRTIIPLKLQKALRDGCSDERNEAHYITGFKQDCALDVEPGMIAATAAALKGDAIIPAELRYQYSYVAAAHTNINRDVIFVGRALDSLKGKRPPAGASP